MRWCAVLVLSALCACERQPKPPVKDEPNQRRDAATDGAAVDARAIDADLIARLDSLAPRERPPPPIIRKHKRGDCRTEYAPRPERDPNPMCRVRGGTFMMDGSRSGKPVQTTVADFDIDQFEVTNQQAVMFLNAHGNECPGIDQMNDPNKTPPCVGFFDVSGIREQAGRYTVERGRELHAPVFTWEGAMRYCAWVGKRVATSAQWAYAAGHDPDSERDLMYPWGDDWRPRSASCLFLGCTATLKNSNGIPVGMYDGTGGRGDGSSPWGLHDTAGGASELVFECDEPNTTCMPGGQTCSCRKLVTSNGGAVSPDKLRVAYRIDHTEIGGGASGVRCVRIR